MSWFALRVQPQERRDAMIGVLIDAGGGAVQEEGGALLTHFRTEWEARQAAGAARELEPNADCSIEPVAEIDWSLAWRAGMRVFEVGGLTIAPPWLAGALDPSRAIVIDPGMAFGTGDHASTRGAVRLLQAAIRREDVVADLGAGSAVLSIAAAKLGARRVIAVELDPDALGNARENIERNGVSDVIDLREGDALMLLPLAAPVDLVVANILSGVITTLLPAIALALAPRGRAILAGILESERADMLRVLGASGWCVAAEDIEQGWWSAWIKRP